VLIAETLCYVTQKTRQGWLLVAQSDIGICFAEFASSKAALEKKLGERFPHASLKVETSARHPLSPACNALIRYLDGQGPCPAPPLDLRGTPFQRKVWRQLQKTSPRQTLSYGALAKRIGAPKAIRAVASACAANRIALLVPCHRVLRADGGLGGYRWGVPLKKYLLELEKSHP
jgi:AraC family transcriptional regulator of adaptative response/methylated-DNA-[protein]-cysteine methyltransferase